MALTPGTILADPARLELPASSEDARLIVGTAVDAALYYDRGGELLAAAWRLLTECARRGRLSLAMPFVAKLSARAMCSGQSMTATRDGLVALRAASTKHCAELDAALAAASYCIEGSA